MTVDHAKSMGALNELVYREMGRQTAKGRLSGASALDPTPAVTANCSPKKTPINTATRP